MGQKVHPESMRVGYIHDWKSNWFNEKHFADYLAEDVAIRNHITGKLAHAGLSDITIRKDANEVEVNIHTARPGIVIGKSGSEVDALRTDLHRITRKQIKVNILEIKRPELDAKLVAVAAVAAEAVAAEAVAAGPVGAASAEADRVPVAVAAVAPAVAVAGPRVPASAPAPAARVGEDASHAVSEARQAPQAAPWPQGR